MLVGTQGHSGRASNVYVMNKWRYKINETVMLFLVIQMQMTPLKDIIMLIIYLVGI